MKKIDINNFTSYLKEELENYEHYQVGYSSSVQKTTGEWLESFLSFCGLAEDEIEDGFGENYDDEFYYGQDLQYEELVNRRKYRSFRDDDRY